MTKGRVGSFFRRLLQIWLTAVGAVGLTLMFFLVLPLIQAIGKKPETDSIVTAMNTASTPPPPPPPEEEDPPEEEEEPEEKPELNEEPQKLDLSQLELVLQTDFGDGWGGDLGLQLSALGASGKELDTLFTEDDLDQKPRALRQPPPVLNEKVRKKAPGQVYVTFYVNERGRVEDPKILSSTDPAFERPVLTAVKKWVYEPGKRNGSPVRFRIRQPITFPAQS